MWNLCATLLVCHRVLLAYHVAFTSSMYVIVYEILFFNRTSIYTAKRYTDKCIREAIFHLLCTANSLYYFYCIHTIISGKQLKLHTYHLDIFYPSKNILNAIFTFLDHKNMGVDASKIFLSLIVFMLCLKIHFLVMADLIYISDI